MEYTLRAGMNGCPVSFLQMRDRIAQTSLGTMLLFSPPNHSIESLLGACDTKSPWSVSREARGEFDYRRLRRLVCYYVNDDCAPETM